MSHTYALYTFFRCSLDCGNKILSSFPSTDSLSLDVSSLHKLATTKKPWAVKTVARWQGESGLVATNTEMYVARCLTCG